jgi:hypothetical protein
MNAPGSGAPLTAPHVTTGGLCRWKAINKEGRHVGLDFYDLLIEGHFAQNPDASVWDRCDDALEAHDGSCVDFVKYFANRSCDRFAPSSVRTTDFAFVAGSEM